MLFYLYCWFVLTIVLSVHCYIFTNMIASDVRSEMSEIKFLEAIFNTILFEIIFLIICLFIYFVFYRIPVFLYSIWGDLLMIKEEDINVIVVALN